MNDRHCSSNTLEGSVNDWPGRFFKKPTSAAKKAKDSETSATPLA